MFKEHEERQVLLGIEEALVFLRRLESKLDTLLAKETIMAQTLADLQAAVAAETTIDASAVTLLGGLSAQIAALKSAGTDPATAAAIDALATQVTTDTSSLSAAVTANTPAATS